MADDLDAYAVVVHEVFLPADDFEDADEFREGVLDAIGEDPRKGHYFDRVDFPNADGATVRDRLLELAGKEPHTPWDLVRIVATELDERREYVRATLRELVEEGSLTPTGTGDIRRVNDA